MEKRNYSIEIDAPAEKVWQVLWTPDSYTDWTGVFCEGSSVKSDFSQGSRAHFLTPNGDGMYSNVEENRENRIMSFKHIGMLKDGKELPLDDETRTWSGAMETYRLSEKDGKTRLDVELDITEEHAGYFDGAFPKGLERVKELAEG